MKATNFFEDFIIRTFGVFSSRTYEIHHKIAHLLSHSCSEPVEAEDSYNSGMFNELCHCKPSQAFVFSFPLGVSYLMQLQITSHSLRCAKHTIIIFFQACRSQYMDNALVDALSLTSANQSEKIDRYPERRYKDLKLDVCRRWKS